MKAFSATWVGDDDPSAQIIFMGDLRFIKGDVREVPEGHAFGEMIFGNPIFQVEVEEPVENDRDALFAELEAAGIDFDKRTKTETLRALLKA